MLKTPGGYRYLIKALLTSQMVFCIPEVILNDIYNVLMTYHSKS